MLHWKKKAPTFYKRFYSHHLYDVLFSFVPIYAGITHQQIKPNFLLNCKREKNEKNFTGKLGSELRQLNVLSNVLLSLALPHSFTWTVCLIRPLLSGSLRELIGWAFWYYRRGESLTRKYALAKLSIKAFLQEHATKSWTYDREREEWKKISETNYEGNTFSWMLVQCSTSHPPSPLIAETNFHLLCSLT